LEEVVGCNLALVDLYRGAQRQDRAGVASSWDVVGYRATHRAHGAYLEVTNIDGQGDQRRDRLLGVSRNTGHRKKDQLLSNLLN
jgi:hypothetical protein